MHSILSFFCRLTPHANLILFLGASATLGAAYVFQYGFDYAPCDLCYTQRYPYMAVIALCGIAVLGEAGVLKISESILITIVAIASALLFWDAGIAVYHVGVEQGWWQGPTACSAALQLSGTLEEQMAQLMAAPLVRCDVPAWTLFGISMAGYNILIALGLGLFGALSWRQQSQ